MRLWRRWEEGLSGKIDSIIYIHTIIVMYATGALAWSGPALSLLFCIYGYASWVDFRGCQRPRGTAAGVFTGDKQCAGFPERSLGLGFTAEVQSIRRLRWRLVQN